MNIKLKEDQIFAFIQFLNYTGLFNTFRLGVLRPIMDLEFNAQDVEV